MGRQWVKGQREGDKDRRQYLPGHRGRLGASARVQGLESGSA